MPRRLRVEFPGAVCHVVSRGDRREDSFEDDVDRPDFLNTLAETSQKTGFKVHAVIRGAAWGGIRRRRSIARAGCEWTGCWAVAARDDADDGVDCAAAADGNEEERGDPIARSDAPGSETTAGQRQCYGWTTAMCWPFALGRRPRP